MQVLDSPKFSEDSSIRIKKDYFTPAFNCNTTKDFLVHSNYERKLFFFVWRKPSPFFVCCSLPAILRLSAAVLRSPSARRPCPSPSKTRFLTTPRYYKLNHLIIPTLSSFSMFPSFFCFILVVFLKFLALKFDSLYGWYDAFHVFL